MVEILSLGFQPGSRMTSVAKLVRFPCYNEFLEGGQNDLITGRIMIKVVLCLQIW